MATMRRHMLATLMLFAPFAGCRTGETPSGEVPCRELVAATPAEWPRRWEKVRAIGSAVTPALIKALRHNPDGPGAQAAVHLLGTLQDASARPFLEELLADGTSLSTEAALALGSLGEPASVPVLRAVVSGRDKHVTTRAAAAAALVTLGRARDVAGFLEAVFLAAGPYGAQSTRAQGLPRKKTRWALERYTLIEALRARYEGETFGLDEDSSWAALRDGTAKLRAFLNR